MQTRSSLPEEYRGNYYHKFSTALRRIFGERVQKISLHAGFTCPNRDGSISEKGCIYCDNRSFNIPERLGITDLDEQIKQGIEAGRRRYKAKKFIAYFQSYTNTYGPLDFLKQQYDKILPYAEIVGLSISTRPDCINRDILGLIKEYQTERVVWLEYGLQSSHDKTLHRINRGHSYDDFCQAVSMTHVFSFRICCHIILGLPGEDKEDMLVTARRIAALPIDSVKFHPLHVIRDTVLADDFRRGKISLLSQKDYIDAVVSFLEYLPPHIVIQRMTADANCEFLLAPDWIHQKGTLLNEIDLEFARRNTYQGIRCK